MRKQHYLTISQRDSDAFHLLLNCNCCLHSHLLNFTSENRIRSYLKEKLIERVDIQDRFVYRLTDKGFKAFSREITPENFRYHSNSIEHDIALAQKYVSVMTQDPSSVWRNEQDLKHDRQEQVDSLREQGRFHDAERLLHTSVPDCSITISHGISYGFDITTEHYTSEDVQLKEDFCSEMGMEFHYERI